VVIEHEAARQDWIAAGVAADRIDLIRPGIDLEHFSMAEAPASGPFRLLFASSPSEVGEIEPRGIGLLIELARLRPDVEILVPWRIWGDVSAALRAVEAMSPPSNFVVRPGDVADMRAIYATSHATVACFDQGVGKTCPNFVLEGLAVGRPCLVTSSVGVADVIAQTGGGVVVSRDAQALARGADQLQQNWQAYSGRARHTARDHYDLEMFRRSYQALYERTAAGRAA
jgi:glycosyltransferase involved in cell wall biosynthesis